MWSNEAQTVWDSTALPGKVKDPTALFSSLFWQWIIKEENYIHLFKDMLMNVYYCLGTEQWYMKDETYFVFRNGDPYKASSLCWKIQSD